MSVEQAGAVETPVASAAARFIAGAPERQYEAEIVDAAKLCLTDWVGCAVGAFHDPAAEAVRRAAENFGAYGESRILLAGTSSPAVAALINGTTGHCLDFDDTHATGGAHLSSPTWATALALASEMNLSEAQALGAFITGFEIGAALPGDDVGPAFQFRGFHPTSTFTRFSACGAAAVLLGLSEAQALNALGIAATTAGGLNASFGTMAKPFHAGKAAMDGILAAELAQQDFASATHAIDAPDGLSGTFVQDGSARIGAVQFTPGRMLLSNAFKPYACCRATHPAVEAAQALAGAVAGKPIKRVWIEVNPYVTNHAARPNPTTAYEGKFSVYFSVALGLNGYHASAADYSEERLWDPAVRAIMPKVEVSPTFDRALTSARMEVELQSGERLVHEVPISKGYPGNPISWEDMRHKFTALVEPELHGQTATLFEALRRFDEPGRLGEMLDLLSR